MGDDANGYVSDDGLQRYKCFIDMCLADGLLRGIYGSCGFEAPLKFQQLIIKPIAEGRDVMGVAPAGNGKATAGLIGCMQRTDPTLPKCQALVLTATRQRAVYIHQLACKLGSGLEIMCLSPRASGHEEEHIPRNVQHVYVATPGIILSKMKQDSLWAEDVTVIMLDEADVLMSKELRGPTRAILKRSPRDVQICVFAAKDLCAEQIMQGFSFEILGGLAPRRFVHIHAKRPTCCHGPAAGARQGPAGSESFEGLGLAKEVLVGDPDRQAPHYCVYIKTETEKAHAVRDLWEVLIAQQAIIYCNRSGREMEQLVKRLETHGCPAARLHAKVESREFEVKLLEFHSGKLRVLIVPDHLDLQCTLNCLVLNYDLPHVESYARRFVYGKSRPAAVFNLVADRREGRRMRQIVRYHHIQVNDVPADILVNETGAGAL